MATEKKSTTPKPAAKLTIEEKRARFLDKAPGRVDRVVTSIGALSKLSRRAAYDFTPTQVSQILGTIGKACETMEQAFTTTNEKGKVTGFSFK